MFVSSLRPTWLTLMLRWVLAALLVFNGVSAAPLVQARTSSADMATQGATGDHGNGAQALQAHCHEPAAPTPDRNQKGGKCPCCPGGSDCPCAPLVVLSLPPGDMTPMPIPTLRAGREVPELAAAPRPRLLRPPIA